MHAPLFGFCKSPQNFCLAALAFTHYHYSPLPGPCVSFVPDLSGWSEVRCSSQPLVPAHLQLLGAEGLVEISSSPVGSRPWPGVTGVGISWLRDLGSISLFLGWGLNRPGFKFQLVYIPARYPSVSYVSLLSNGKSNTCHQVCSERYMKCVLWVLWVPPTVSLHQARVPIVQLLPQALLLLTSHSCPFSRKLAPTKWEPWMGAVGVGGGDGGQSRRPGPLSQVGTKLCKSPWSSSRLSWDHILAQLHPLPYSASLPFSFLSNLSVSHRRGNLRLRLCFKGAQPKPVYKVPVP